MRAKCSLSKLWLFYEWEKSRNIPGLFLSSFNFYTAIKPLNFTSSYPAFLLASGFQMILYCVHVDFRHGLDIVDVEATWKIQNSLIIDTRGGIWQFHRVPWNCCGTINLGDDSKIWISSSPWVKFLTFFERVNASDHRRLKVKFWLKFIFD